MSIFESSDITIPGASAEEQALQSEQAALLRQQRDVLTSQLQQQQALQPILYQQAGLTPIFSDDGTQIIGFETPENPNEETLRQLEAALYSQALADLPSDEERARQKEIQTGFEERTLAALKGELPVDPALIRQLDEQEAQLNEQLRRDLGPGYRTSTPGQQALADFSQRKSELLSGARRGDLTLAEQLGLAREGAGQQSLSQALGLGINTSSLQQSQLSSFLDQASGISGLPGSTAGSFGQIAQGFGQALQPYQFQRSQTFGANQGNAANQQAALNALLGGAGQLGGLALFSPSYNGGQATNLFGKSYDALFG